MNAPFEIHPRTWDWVSQLAPTEIRSTNPVRSNEVNQVYRLETDGADLFLKVGPHLAREYERLQWLQERLPCPRPLGFTAHAGTDCLLMSAVEGDDLARLTARLPPHIILVRLASALKVVHATNIADWPFVRDKDDTVLVHGDACLPNLLYQGDLLSGYIDVGDMTVGEPEMDLAAAVWSLHYNLGPGYGLPFLHKYGMKDADEDCAERLRLRYGQG